MTPVVTGGPVTEVLVTEPVTELVTTTTEIEEKLDEMVLQNGAIEIEEKEVVEDREEVTEVEKIEKEEVELEEKDEDHEEQKGTFEFNVPDIDDDSNGKKKEFYVIIT